MGVVRIETVVLGTWIALGCTATEQSPFAASPPGDEDDLDDGASANDDPDGSKVIATKDGEVEDGAGGEGEGGVLVGEGVPDLNAGRRLNRSAQPIGSAERKKQLSGRIRKRPRRGHGCEPGTGQALADLGIAAAISTRRILAEHLGHMVTSTAKEHFSYCTSRSGIAHGCLVDVCAGSSRRIGWPVYPLSEVVAYAGIEPTCVAPSPQSRPLVPELLHHLVACQPTGLKQPLLETSHLMGIAKPLDAGRVELRTGACA